MKIIVPSLGRAGTAASMKWLPQANRDIIFAVHQDEVDAYAKSYPNTTIMPLSDACRKHIGLVRKEIMQKIRKPLFFVDDDIRIGLKAVTSIAAVFDTIERHLESGASMAGLGQQYFSNIQMAKCELINGDLFAIRNKFVATVYGINPLIFDNCPLELFPVYEDVVLVIHAIQRGGGTIVSYTATHSNVSPPSGGCNSWRTQAIIVECLYNLVNLYPNICSVQDTKNTTHSQQIGIGLRTAWSKIKKLQL